ncbi:Conserved_hypothetical protein [Hexamita inflata]|uniref:Transmembrane protein n=1 Tax=Hexamita inflata TaxID=28002 RepID=A0AA86QLX6_9EUKA|nr:Conserved hypothetical protein [Hexamita inflata]
MILFIFKLCQQYIQQNSELQQLNNCFGDDSYVSINKFLRKAIVQLTITNNIECYQFLNTIGANITLGSTEIPIVLSALYYNYNYSISDQIVFDIPQDVSGVPINLNNYQDETYAILHIFSYSEIAEIELLIFDDIRSDLENCFNDLTINLYPQYVQFIETPLIQCIDQITAQIDLLDTTYVSSVQLNLGTQQYFLDLNQFITKYQAQQQYTEIITPNTDSMRELLSDTFLKASLIVTARQGSIYINLNYKITQIQILSTPILQSNSFVYLYDEKGVLGFKYFLDVQNQAFISTLTYTEVCYRLTGRIKQNVYYSERYFTGQFNASMRTVDFRCDFGSQFQQLACVKQYYDDLQCEVSPIYFLDILFINNGQLQYLVKTQTPQLYDCYKTGRMLIMKNILELQMIWDEASLGCQYDVLPTYSRVVLLSPSSPQHMTTIYESHLDINKQSLKLSCSDLNNACTQLLHDPQLLFQVEIGGFQFQIIIKELKTNNYQKTKAVAAVFGSFFVVSLSVFTVFKIYAETQRIKNLRKRK